jgi:hypothetical protein
MKPVAGGIKRFWSSLFGKSPHVPAQGRTFDDRPPAKRVYYYFQHNALREAAFHAGHSTLAAMLTAGRIGSEQARYFWAKATHMAVSAGAVPSEMIGMLSNDAARAALEAGAASLATVAIHTRRLHTFTAHVLVMPPPEFATDTHFIAIVTEDDAPTEPEGPAPPVRYFTLEASLVPEPMLCEWTADGRHLNHGSQPAPDFETFAAEVLSRARLPAEKL